MSRTLASLNVIPYSNQYSLFEGLAEGFQRGPKNLQPLRLAVPSVPALPKDASVRDRFAMARAVADRFDQYAERRTIGSTEKWAQTRRPISQVNECFGKIMDRKMIGKKFTLLHRLRQTSGIIGENSSNSDPK